MITVLLTILAIFPTPDELEDGFVVLSRDNASALFERVKLGEESVLFGDSEIRLTGTTNGYLATKAVYSDFVLRFEWKFETPEDTDLANFEVNSGVLIGIKPPHKVWPTCLEFQITPDDTGSLFAIDSDFDGVTDREAQRLATRPPGRWNEAEIEMSGKTVVSRLNGRVVAHGTFEGPPGPIGFQSEGGAIRFRKVRIKSIAKP